VTLELDNPHQRTTPHIQTNTVTGQAETDSPGEKPGLYDRIKHTPLSSLNAPSISPIYGHDIIIGGCLITVRKR